MKTRTYSVIALLVIVLFTTTTAFANTVQSTNDGIVIPADAAGFNKIEVKGNVELFISDGPANEIKVYNKNCGADAQVQNHDGVLRIACSDSEKLVVWVTANDLRCITAYDNAQVKSFGKLSAIELDVTLYNNASAQLDVNVYSANITVNDRAKADLKGDAIECWLKCDRSTCVNSSMFSTQNLVKNNISYTISKGQKLAGL